MSIAAYLDKADSDTEKEFIVPVNSLRRLVVPQFETEWKIGSYRRSLAHSNRLRTAKMLINVARTPKRATDVAEPYAVARSAGSRFFFAT